MVDIDDVRGYWDKNPLSSQAIPHPLHTPEYFDFYDKMRERNESVEFSYRLHEYRDFAGKKVLDVGSGNGYVLSRYALEGADVYGVDITPTGIDLCRRRFELMNLEGNFTVASAEALPFEDETFDCVCSIGVVHHTPDTEKALDEIHRVLKPGGRVILMVYHRNSALYQFKFRLERLLTGKSMQQLVNEVDGIGNPKGDVYSRAEFARLLDRYDDVDMFVGLLQGWMLAPRFTARIPDRWVRPFEKKVGWFLYAKGNKRGAEAHG
jgi:SAM-dependent methyltransferase